MVHEPPCVFLLQDPQTLGVSLVPTLTSSLLYSLDFLKFTLYLLFSLLDCEIIYSPMTSPYPTEYRSFNNKRIYTVPHKKDAFPYSTFFDIEYPLVLGLFYHRFLKILNLI